MQLEPIQQLKQFKFNAGEFPTFVSVISAQYSCCPVISLDSDHRLDHKIDTVLRILRTILSCVLCVLVSFAYYPTFDAHILLLTDFIFHLFAKGNMVTVKLSNAHTQIHGLSLFFRILHRIAMWINHARFTTYLLLHGVRGHRQCRLPLKGYCFQVHIFTSSQYYHKPRAPVHSKQSVTPDHTIQTASLPPVQLVQTRANCNEGIILCLTRTKPVFTPGIYLCHLVQMCKWYKYF